MRKISCAAYILLLLFFTALLPGTISAEKPDILLITIDTLRADHVGSYGYKPQTTPSIDKLASTGLVFRNAFTTAPITLPAHATILTGVYPAKHGLRDNAYFQRVPVPLLPELLKDQGYATAAFVSAAPLRAFYGLNRGFDVYSDAGENAERIAEQTVDRALEWMKNSSKPYFLWVHLFDPHAPYDAPAEFADKFRESTYDAEIAYTDSRIQRLLNSAAPNSIRIITADHGESLGEHGESTHGVFVYNATLRVPLIMAGPGIKAESVDTPVSLCDIAPTLAQIAGIPEQKHFDGRSLFRGRTDRMIFAESFYAARNFGYSALVAAIRGDQKYIDAPSAEFYNFKSDPGEKTNRFSNSETGTWKNAVQKYLEPGSTYLPPQPEISTEQREALASLGYAAGNMKESRIDPKTKIGIIEQFNRALNFLSLKDYSAAEILLRKVIREDSSNSFAHRYLANALAAQKRFADAAESYRIAWEKTRDPEIAIQLAKTWNQLGRYIESEKLLEELVQNFPEFLEPRFELASIYMKRNDTNSALKLLREADSSGSPELYNQRGLVYLAAGKFSEAESEFRIASAKGDKAVYWNNLGAALQNLNRVPDAETAFKTALKIDPHYAECEANLAFLFVQTQRWKDAKPHLMNASARQPQFWRVRFTLGIVHEMLGEIREAINVYRKLDQDAPSNWDQRKQLEIRIQKLTEKNP